MATSTAISSSAPENPLTQAQKPLYTDFTNDNPMVDIQPANAAKEEPGTRASTAVKATVPEKKPHHVINFDPSRPYFCHVCQFDLLDMEEFMKHSICVWHIKKTALLFSYKVKAEEKEKKKEKVSFHCQSCLMTCNNENAWNAHLLGQKHRKVLEKQGAERAMQKIFDKQPPPLMAYGRGTPHLMGSGQGRGTVAGRGGRGLSGGRGRAIPGSTHLAQLHGRKPYEKPVHNVRQPSQSGPIGARDFAQYSEPLIGLEYVTEIQVIGQSPRYHCELCDAKFDHNLKFPHLVGAKHRLNVLKEKNPQAAMELRNGIKKRSELTGKLLEEAQKLEFQEGRQQVKTRVEKSPFAAVNEAGVARGRASTRGDFSRGRGVTRGRGKGVGPTGRGRSYGQNYQQYDNPRGPGRGRGSTSWGQQFPQDPAQSQLSYTGNMSGYDQSYNQGGQGSSLLPPAAFRSRSPPRNPPSQSYHDQYQMYHNPPHDQFSDSQHDGQTFVQQSHPQQFMQPNVAPPTPQPQHVGTIGTAYNHEAEQAQTPSSTGAKPTGAVSGLLQGALGDLKKLVNSEEDASMALQVSNALTHALLNFRMKQMPESEDATSVDLEPQHTQGY